MNKVVVFMVTILLLSGLSGCAVSSKQDFANLQSKVHRLENAVLLLQSQSDQDKATIELLQDDIAGLQSQNEELYRGSIVILKSLDRLDEQIDELNTSCVNRNSIGVADSGYLYWRY